MKFNFNFIKDRIINLIIKPQDEWKKIKGEEATTNSLYLNYAVFLAAIPAIAGLIGFSIIGFSYGLGTFRLPIARSLIWTVLHYVFALGGALILGLIIDALAPNFNSKKNMVDSLKIAIYSSSIAWAFGILYLIPGLRIVTGLASLYGLYIMFLGLKEIKTPPKDKEIAYFVVTVVIAIVVFFFVGLFTNLIAFGGIYRFGMV